MAFKLSKQYRLPGYDYSRVGAYFITICTKDRACYFGEIVDAKMELSEIGRIAETFWLEIPDRFKNIKLDAWVIMPNHVHGILMIEEDGGDIGCEGDFSGGNIVCGKNVCRDAPRRVPTPMGVPTSGDVVTPQLGIRPLPKNSISSIINHFKGNVKRHCNKNDIAFAWQSRFHDRIIRNERALNVIRRYIVNNPARWARDRNR